MEWETFFPLIFFVIAFGLPFLFRLLRRGEEKKLDELFAHLQLTGVKGVVLEKEEIEEKWGHKRSWGEKMEGVIAVEERSIDAIALTSQSSQYGTNYYIEYLVKWRSELAADSARKTSMVLKKSPRIWGRVTDIEWKGDPSLAQRLNFDYQLKYRLQQSGLSGFKGGIAIHPEPEHGYSRIRTSYQLPSPDLFESIHTVAKHIKAGS
jgi:hypothetical protein